VTEFQVNAYTAVASVTLRTMSICRPVMRGTSEVCAFSGLDALIGDNPASISRRFLNRFCGLHYVKPRSREHYCADGRSPIPFVTVMGRNVRKECCTAGAQRCAVALSKDFSG
jgi:hypothetical protein